MKLNRENGDREQGKQWLNTSEAKMRAEEMDG